MVRTCLLESQHFRIMQSISSREKPSSPLELSIHSRHTYTHAPYPCTKASCSKGSSPVRAPGKLKALQRVGGCSSSETAMVSAVLELINGSLADMSLWPGRGDNVGWTGC
uniref:Uncharacterized protein n=1 Tax=Micrurus surinamensis TaxID=129470 RepID=A0A2D4PYS4_MICSU